MTGNCSRLARRARGRDGFALAGAGGQGEQRRDEAGGAGEVEGPEIAGGETARQAGAGGGGGGAELVRGEDPAEDDAGALAAKDARGDADRRRHRGDPVEAVKDGKEREAVKCERRRRQIEQRKPAQTVVPEQQLA